MTKAHQKYLIFKNKNFKIFENISRNFKKLLDSICLLWYNISTKEKKQIKLYGGKYHVQIGNDEQ